MTEIDESITSMAEMATGHKTFDTLLISAETKLTPTTPIGSISLRSERHLPRQALLRKSHMWVSIRALCLQ
jgi:hypothetical protein